MINPIENPIPYQMIYGSPAEGPCAFGYMIIHAAKHFSDTCCARCGWSLRKGGGQINVAGQGTDNLEVAITAMPPCQQEC